MPRVSYSNNELFSTSNSTSLNNVHFPTIKPIHDFLTQKHPEKLMNINRSSSTPRVDLELIHLVDEFYRLTTLNTLPMVNLLATAVGPFS